MADTPFSRRACPSRWLARSTLGSTALLVVMASQPAQAQTRLVSVCSGVSLPRSVVTGIISPVVTGITGPTETTVNGILNGPLLGALLPPLNLNATGLLNQAAAGDPVTLQVLATDGTVVGPTDQCRATADSFTLDTPAGVAIGGNQIAGLGANGAAAFASDIDAIALGNNARAEAGATGSLALGSGSSVTGANSVALGAGSLATRGALAGYTAVGLTTPQTSAGEVSVGAPDALRQLTNVAAGTAPSDAATVGQVSGVLAQVAALGTSAVQYDGAARDRVTLAGAGGTTIGNLAPGTLAAGSTEAVNGGQLFATNQGVAGNAAAITGLDTRVTADEGQLAGLSTAVTTNTAAITDLQNGVAGTAGNLATLNVQVAGNTTAIANISTALGNQPVRYADAGTPTVPNGGTVSDEATLAGASGGAVGLHNLRGGVIAAGSTDAVNGDQLATTNAQVAANTTAITNLNTIVAGSTVSPVQYSNPATPTVPNGGARTNDVTLAGLDAAAPVALHNVAGGAVAAGSTDAVNGQQLYAVSTAAANSVQYERDATGARTNTVRLAGGNAAAPVAVANVAAGRVAADSTDSVNGAQLYATNQVAQQAAALGANSVQYDGSGTSVSLAGRGGSAVALRNVAAGTAASDAVNVGQLQSGLQNAVAQAGAYTDARVGAALSAVNFDLSQLRRDMSAGTSGALAAAALPQANEPGRTMIAIGGGTYRGQSAVAFGASTFLNDGHSILRLGASVDRRGYAGANAGFGYQF